MKRTLATALLSASLLAPIALAAPASATNGGGHAGRTTQAPATNGGGHAGRTIDAPATNGGGHAGRTSGYCVDTDREGTSTVALPVLSAPAGGQIGTLSAGKGFDFCSNTATVSGGATYVYGEYLTGSTWSHGWMNQGQFKRIVHIA